MALEKLLPREIPPPASDAWRPGHRRHKKPHGLVVYIQYSYMIWGSRKEVERLYDYTTWYHTDRARNDAIAAYNKQAHQKYSAPVAMSKIER